LSEACEAIDDHDSAQRYKADADHLASLFYGPSSPSQDSPAPDPASPRGTAAVPRDPASQRWFVGRQTSLSPPPSADAAVAETAIRDGVDRMMSRLGLSSPEDVDDSTSIRQAERHLHETVTNTGDADVIALSIHSPLTTQPATAPPASRLVESTAHLL